VKSLQVEYLYQHHHNFSLDFSKFNSETQPLRQSPKMSLDIATSTGITIHHDTYPFISPSKFTNSLAGQVVLITGASRGIGRATALAFAAAGARVAALARTKTDIDTHH
jgi:hypothetical protein